MEETRGKTFGAAAIPLVQPDDVQAARKGFRGDPSHVVRIARRIEAVKEKQSGVIPRTRLPMTVREHARVGFDVEVAYDRRGQPRKIARVAPAEKGHAMPV